MSETPLENLASAFQKLSREEMTEFVIMLISNTKANNEEEAEEDDLFVMGNLEECVEQTLLDWSLEVLDDGNEF